MYDIIVIGAGPAGISSAIYATSRDKNVLLIEKEEIGGTISKVSTVTHYSGIIASETGPTFSNRLKEQALASGVKIIYENVIGVSLSDDIKTVTTHQMTYKAKKVILANGCTPRKLGIPGEEFLTGKGIGLNAIRDSENYRGKNIYVIGGADGAIKEAIYLAKLANKLTIIHFEDKLGAIPEFLDQITQLNNVEVLTNSRLTAVYGKEQVERLEITNEATQSVQIIEDSGCGIFVYVGSAPNTHLYEGLTLINGYICVNEKMETSISGVYAAGDICAKQVRQIATAVADGAIAGINASI